MRAGQLLFWLFLCVPIVEIYCLIQVGTVIGGLNVVALIIFSAMLGSYLVRTQGIATAQRVQYALAHGQLPAMDILEGLVILVAGVLLITPGFFTDFLGMLSLFPLLRQTLLRSIIKRGIASVQPPPDAPAAHQNTTPSANVIEGKFHREDS